MLIIICLICIIDTHGIHINYNNITILESSVFNLQSTLDLINNLKNRQNNKDKLRESDYNFIVSSILPYYLNYNMGWRIGSEVWNEDSTTAKKKTDYIFYKINGHGITYAGRPTGYPIPTHLHEGKTRVFHLWMENYE